jgi:hypothetical protein
MVFSTTQPLTDKIAALALIKAVRRTPMLRIAGYCSRTYARTDRVLTRPLLVNRGKYVFSTIQTRQLLPNTAGHLCRNFSLFTSSHNLFFRKCDNPCAKLLWLGRLDSVNQQHTDTAQTVSSLHIGLFTAFSRIWMQSGLLLRQQKLLNNLPALLTAYQTPLLPAGQAILRTSSTVTQPTVGGGAFSNSEVLLLDEAVTDTTSITDLSLIILNSFFFDILIVEDTTHTSF